MGLFGYNVTLLFVCEGGRRDFVLWGLSSVLGGLLSGGLCRTPVAEMAARNGANKIHRESKRQDT